MLFVDVLVLCSSSQRFLDTTATATSMYQLYGFVDLYVVPESASFVCRGAGAVQLFPNVPAPCHHDLCDLYDVPESVSCACRGASAV